MFVLLPMVARGVKSGNPNITADGRVKGNEEGIKTIKEVADNAAARVMPTILSHKAAGLSLRKIAAELNNMSVPTPRGSFWTATAVRYAMARQ